MDHDSSTGMVWGGANAGAGAATLFKAMRDAARSSDPVDLPMAALFDELSFGVALVDRQGRLVHASRAARLQLQSQRGLRIVDDAVSAEAAAESAALQRALEGACNGRRSYLAFGGGASRLDVAILPIGDGGRDGMPMAAMVFEKSAGSGGLALYFFSQAYHLTRTEQAVLSELCDGASVVDAAKRLGSSVHTVRTHVRSILTKTGQQNLRALIRRVGMLPPVGARFAIAHARGEAVAAGGRTPGQVSREVVEAD
jgi:DNA-binding CsgD family transcriptional regulator